MDSEFFERVSKMTPQRLALLATRLKAQVDAQREPIAIVGMACRLPGGVGDPDGFWELLASGRDAIREVPADRWNIDSLYDPDPDAPGRMSARSGGFLEDVANFDAAFFGIAAREALTLDPQQRLLLEVSWEALEQAGIAPSKLSGTSAGVFVGICNSDHFQRMLSRGADRIDAYVASGNAHSTAAGRISYCLGLRGPALAIDTACSSSLVAFHVACQSLRRGESQIALAGGVNLMCSPETTIALTKAHMLAPDGRCKTFDAAADGFSRGEGCVVLVLKRLSDALSAKDRVLAVVRGTAVNQDGRSGGLTVPNGPSQEAVVRAALADAGLEPHDVDYVEAHGTGTSLGDPIEVRALGGVFGPGRPNEKPLWIGSVKTNFGHLESAAGLAGVLKVVLSMLHERVPKHLHFREPSPHIEWASFPIEVTAEGRAWPKGTRPRRAGVSSFGFSGTNAHIVIEEAPPPVSESAASVERPLHLLCLSAQDRPALVELAAAAERALAAGTPLAQAAHTAGVGRAHFTERLAVVAGEASEARAALRAFIDGAPHPALEQGSAPKSGPLEVVFLFTGQGSQYPGMARALYESAPVFRDVIDRCATILGPDSAGRTLHDVLAPGPAEGAPIHETEWTQPALFAVEYGVSELWRSFGVEPSAVIGHSVGEYVAACVAGVYTLEEGLTLIRERGRLLQALPPGGAMAAVFAPERDVARAVEPFAARLGIAAVNGPESVVISGASELVERVLADFQAKNVQGQRLFVSFAAHSPLVEPAMAAMRACASKVQFQAPKLPIAWNVTGGAPLPGGAPDAGYFERHLREPVRFAEGVASLSEYGAFLEVGPHPVLIALAERCLPDPEKRALLGTLRRSKDDWRELMTSLARLYCRGAKVDHAGVDAGYARTRVPWPTYPFQRRRFWVEPTEAAPRRAARPAGGSLAGQRVSAAVPLFEVTLAPDAPAYLGQHRLLGSALVAGPVFMELAQAAAKSAFGPARRTLADFTIREPLVLPDAGRTLQTHLTRRGDGSIDFGVSSAPSTEDGEWTLHAEGRLVPSSKAQPSAVALAELEQRLGPSAPSDAFYARLVELGIELGGAFRSLGAVRVSGAEALANVALAPGESSDAMSFAHPGLLDGCLQAAGSTLPTPKDPGDVYLFSGIDQVELFGPLPRSLLAHATSRAADPDGNEWRADVTLYGADGAVLGALSGISMRRASRDVLSRVANAGGDSELFYEVTWRSVPGVQPAAPSLVGAEHFAARLQSRFDELSRSTQLAAYDEILPALDRLSRDYVLSALFELGFDPARGRRFEARAEAARLRVEPRYARLFARLLEMLAEDGLLERSADGSYEIARELPAPRAAAHPDFGVNDGELSMLGRAGPVLSRVLRGTQDPLQLLFPGGTFLEARRLYVESPYARTYNQALVEGLLAAIAKLPDGARLRILEIGAGTGGTTTFVLPKLPASRVEYTFTDLSPLFLQRAAETFESHRFVQYKLLDIENEPFSQGFEPESYDVVIAANVLHATADLGRAVSHAQKLLEPSGMLFLLEGVSAERWVDLTFGLTEGWWRFTDTALRPSYPLIDRRAWSDLLARLGFSSVTFAPEGSWAERRSAQQVLIVARNTNPPRTVTLIGGPESLKEACLEELRKRGDVGKWLPSQAVEAELPSSAQIVYLGALELDPALSDLAERAEELAVQLPLAWLSRMAREDRPGRVFLVTRGAQRVAGTAAPGAEWQAPLWGVARGFALEHPTRFGAIVDLPPELDDANLAQRLLDEVDPRRRVVDHEEQVALRGSERFGARLAPRPAPPPRAPRLRSDATYLITGGFGGLGLLVARWLVEHGARTLVLLGRRPELGLPEVRALQELGARVIPVAADLSDAAALETLRGELGRDGVPPLRGVVHCAADLSSAPIESLSREQISRMLGPKLRGTLLLEQASRGADLDFFVLFSSTTALLGASGLAHYAAANAFLDAFAEARRGPLRSVNWGTWQAMRLATAQDQQSYRQGGLLPMATEDALDALGRVIAADEPGAVVANIDWGILKPLYEARRPRRFLDELGRAPAARVQASGAEAEQSLAARLAGIPPEMRRDVILDFVVAEVAAVLGAERNVELDKGLFELGMDSLMSVELKKRLERGVSRPLPSTLTFNYPNVNALTSFLEAELGNDVAAAAAATAPVVEAKAPAPSAELDELSVDELAARLRASLEGT